MTSKDEDYFTPFLQYDPPRPVQDEDGSILQHLEQLRQEMILGSNSTTGVGGISAAAAAAAPSAVPTSAQFSKTQPIAVAKLAAAKNAAREMSRKQYGFTGSAAANGGSAAAAAASGAAPAAAPSSQSGVRRDPATRMPTPPAAFGRRAVGRAGLAAAAAASSTSNGGGAAAATASKEPLPEVPDAGGVLPLLMRDVRDTATILSTMFPPQLVIMPETRQAGLQRVSRAPASRDAAAVLHAAVKERLRVRRAQADGLCAIRREIYEDLFSELVRQTTVEEPARGVLLQRLRDEAQASLALHAALLARAEYYCSRQLLASTAAEDELRARLAELQRERDAVAAKKHELEVRQKRILQTHAEENEVRTKKMQEELAYLRKTNQQLSLKLKMETEKASSGAVMAAPSMV